MRARVCSTDVQGVRARVCFCVLDGQRYINVRVIKWVRYRVAEKDEATARFGKNETKNPPRPKPNA